MSLITLITFLFLISPFQAVALNCKVCITYWKKLFQSCVMPVTVVADNPEESVINKILSCVANADGLEWVLLEECFPSGMNYDVEAGKVTWLRARPSVSIGANEVRRRGHIAKDPPRTLGLDSVLN